MPFYVVCQADRYVSEAKVYEKLEDATVHVPPQHLEAAVRALEGLRTFRPSDFKVARRRPIPNEWRLLGQESMSSLLLVKCLTDWKPGSVMVLRDGRPARFAENRHLGVYLVMCDELAGRADWRTMAATWLGLATDAVPADPLTYLVERRGLALHWIEERIRNQVTDFRIVELRA